MRRTAALIVGGGPAGAAAAITLARAGTRPLLTERTTGPHDMVCGGFLGRDALASLGSLGIDVGALGARPIVRVRLIAGTRRIEAPLPFAAAGLSRRTLDAALLDAASTAGAIVERGRTARQAEDQAVRFADGERIAADMLLLATGKHDLRGLARPRIAHPALGFRIGCPVDAATARALDGTVELHLFDGGYAGLLMQEDGTANLCLSVDARRAPRDGAALLADLAHETPLLAERVAYAPAHGWSAIAQVPYGWRQREGAPGLLRLGDQAAVIASLVGDGVAIALASGIAAGHAITAGTGSTANYQHAFAATRTPSACHRRYDPPAGGGSPHTPGGVRGVGRGTLDRARARPSDADLRLTARSHPCAAPARALLVSGAVRG